ncbi:hypothetical protein F4861DRAFT_102821 [Xylaria intraflava]|nr:hypothetical protein F4861DRAFT_102821 [Xylaria intraflava]
MGFDRPDWPVCNSGPGVRGLGEGAGPGCPFPGGVPLCEVWLRPGFGLAALCFFVGVGFVLLDFVVGLGVSGWGLIIWVGITVSRLWLYWSGIACAWVIAYLLLCSEVWVSFLGMLGGGLRGCAREIGAGIMVLMDPDPDSGEVKDGWIRSWPGMSCRIGGEIVERPFSTGE